jgi:thiamine-phosphate pyrophosphorylase
MLYAITPLALCEDDTRLLTAVETALHAGLRLLQYRDKSSNDEKRLRQVQALHRLCQRYGAKLIVNDDVRLAAHADGVHLGQSDESIRTARALLGAEAIIGATCHHRLDLAEQAVQAGASYVAFGAMFPSKTKPHATLAPFSVLKQARALGVPVCAIGGITPERAASVYAAGADWLACVEGVFSGDGGRDVAGNVRGFNLAGVQSGVAP